jgi:enoyl-CoA hydratase/carnithine racemase
MGLIEIDTRDEVAIVKLNHGVTNAINLDLILELAKDLEDLNKDPNVNSVVLTSNNEKFFAIGFDLPELFDYDKEKMKLFYQTFNRLSLDIYTFPKPVIAALTGHAIAGGCILAICCDYRFIADGKKLMGLNEIKLGIPVPYPADCILRQLVGARIAQDMCYTGEFYKPRILFNMGLVDQVLSAEELQKKAVEKAKLLGEMPKEAFEVVKHNRVERVTSQVLDKLEERERFFLEKWFTDETRILIKEAIKKF